MNRSRRLGTSAARALVGLALVGLVISFGCTGPRIRVASTDDSALRSRPGFEVTLTPAAASGRSALSESAVESLLERTREALRARGYPIDEDAPEADAFMLDLREELVERRTYTADTDANGTRLVKRPEAVVTLRALAADGKQELWRCEARGLVTRSDGRPGAGSEALYERLLERALARIPARS
ncbi:hypothetical protein K2X89_09840 [Myxococcota bacterium]|nr:hypothetical protein [Myxococcota bacterium]